MDASFELGSDGGDGMAAIVERGTRGYESMAPFASWEATAEKQ